MPFELGRRLVMVSVSAGVVLLGGAVLAQQAGEPAAEPEVMHGERLDPAGHGPGVIESMDVVLAREAARPAGEAVNPKARNGKPGAWVVPSRRGTFNPKSGEHNVVNQWGDTSMGIGFNQVVDVQGAWFAGQAGPGAWTTGLQAIGFRNGQQIAASDWLRELGEQPKFLAMNFDDVDRIVIVAEPVINGAGFYGMDDLTFTPDRPDAEAIVIGFEDAGFNQKLTGTDYRGLTWESGTGDFEKGSAIPGPARVGEFIPPAPRSEPLPPAPPEEMNDGDGEPEGGLGTTPTLSQQFQGIVRGDAGQFSFPPDTCGAIGPNHFVEVTNRNYSVYNKTTGVRVVNSSLDSFLPGSAGDPRVLYDQHSGRWIVIVSDFQTRIYLAVSLTNDPTGSFFKTSFIASQGSDTGFFPDYPTLGVDANGIYTSAALANLTIFAIDKAPLIAGAPSLGTVTAFRNLPFDGAIQPVHTFGSPFGEYCISRNGANSGLLRLRRIDPPLNAPTLVNLPNPSITSYSDPPDVPASGSVTPLDSVDGRLMNAVYRNGFIYTTHTINVAGRAGVRWYRINAGTGSVLESGQVDDPVQHYFFPTIAANASGDLLLGFSGCNAGQFVGSYYTGRLNSDPSGQTGPVQLLRAGVAAQNNIDNLGRNRWGDYSLTSVDPVDDLSMWTVQAYGHANNIWGTQIGKFAVGPANNLCSAGTIVTAGSWPLNTLGATTDGPDEGAACENIGITHILNDVWFRFAAQCTGTATVSTCGATFNTKIAVYGSTCPAAPGSTIACSDTGSCGSSAEVSFPVTAGQLYRIRVGSPTGTMGTGTMVITCDKGGTPCPSDIAPAGGNGEVNVDDLLAVINAWGPCGDPNNCPADIAPEGGNDEVNVDDLLAIINAWGPCP